MGPVNDKSRAVGRKRERFMIYSRRGIYISSTEFWNQCAPGYFESRSEERERVAADSGSCHCRRRSESVRREVARHVVYPYAPASLLESI